MKTPLIHVTDLIHPPWDCDDQVDLATCYAFPELDLKAVVLDWHCNYEERRHYEPAFTLVTQINWMTGLAVPAAVGPHQRLQSVDDDGLRFPRVDQAGIHLILDTLRRVDEPAYISIVGSCRAVAAAFNRDPDLFARRVRGILLVAGTALRVPEDKLDTNSAFDPHAYVRLMRSGLPIRWYPPSNYLRRTCIQPTEEQVGEASRHHSKFVVPHQKLFERLPSMLYNWLVFGFSGNLRGDVLRVLHEDWGGCLWWGIIGPGSRCMSSTPAFVMAAGRKLARTKAGWRFVPAEQSAEEEFPFEQIPVTVEVNDAGHTDWYQTENSNILLFDHPTCACESAEGPYAEAMGEALNALLREEMPLDDRTPWSG